MALILNIRATEFIFYILDKIKYFLFTMCYNVLFTCGKRKKPTITFETVVAKT